MRSTLIVAACMLLGVVLGDGLDGAEEWEKAGLNRESAAAYQQSEADLLIQLAQDAIRESAANQADRSMLLLRAANAHIKAGSLYGAAMGNLDKAAGNWNKAKSSFRSLKMNERLRNAGECEGAARGAAKDACESAAEAYENASGIYQEPALNQGDKAAAASERAAIWREKLATRK